MAELMRRLRGLRPSSAPLSPTAGESQELDDHKRPQQLRRLNRRLDRLEVAVRETAPDDRLERLEAEVQELRALGARVAELADVVTELLAVAAQREDPDFRRIVEKYLDGV